MIRIVAIATVVALAASPLAELRVPAATAYLAPDPDGARVSATRPVTPFAQPASSIIWYGQLKSIGTIDAAIALQLPQGDSLRLALSVGASRHLATIVGTGGESRLSFGSFEVTDTGYQKFELSVADHRSSPQLGISALLLSGTPAESAHFNLDPRRNAASVHLRFPIDSGAIVTGFYNEVTAVDDPVNTYYMACGFARGYFGMQVNSPTERRIIFSVWDAASGSSATDRSTVDTSNYTRLLGKGEGVEASVFGNEGTGGHSHLVYNWKTGSTQKFFVTAKVIGDATIYSGYWFHPEQQRWILIASFRAAKDGRALRGLYSFSEDFDGSTGHLRRKALYGPQWIQLANGSWQELTRATFSHDATGKEDRLDRYMGVENGRFFLSHGGFVPGFTMSGTLFTRPSSGAAPKIDLPM